MRITKTFKQGTYVQQWWDAKQMAKKGYQVIAREEGGTERSMAKTVGLGLIFLPLALLGTTKMVKITYERPDNYERIA